MDSRALLKPFVNSGTSDEYFTLFANIVAEIKNLWYPHEIGFVVLIDTNYRNFPVSIHFPSTDLESIDLVRICQKKISDLIYGKTFPSMIININDVGIINVQLSDTTHPNHGPTQSISIDIPHCVYYEGFIVGDKIGTEIYNLWKHLRRDFYVRITHETIDSCPVAISILSVDMKTTILVFEYRQRIATIVNELGLDDSSRLTYCVDVSGTITVYDE